MLALLMLGKSIFRQFHYSLFFGLKSEREFCRKENIHHKSTRPRFSECWWCHMHTKFTLKRKTSQALFLCSGKAAASWHKQGERIFWNNRKRKKKNFTNTTTTTNEEMRDENKWNTKVWNVDQIVFSIPISTRSELAHTKNKRAT